MNAADRKLARELIGTDFAPAGHSTFINRARESRAYYYLNPYPFYNFSNWKTETRGQLPICLPIIRNAEKRGASWLFGKSPQIGVADDEKLAEELSNIWQSNRMPTQAVSMARKGAHDGGVALKFAFDPDGDPQVTIQVLSIVDEVTCWTAPHDRDLLLMVRIQYPHYDARDGKWYWYREEWTDDEFVTYQPLQSASFQQMAAGNPLSGIRPPDSKEFILDKRRSNPFGLIPVTIIRNLEGETVYGCGDFFDCFRVMDRINLTHQLMDMSNQLDKGNIIYIDAVPEYDELDQPPGPNEPLSIKSDGDERKADVKLIERSGRMREPMADYADRLEDMLLEAGGSIRFKPEDVTNKGNMTSAVLSQLYAPLVEITEEKRRTYGEDGICKFLESMCIGLKRAGGSAFKAFGERDVTLKWAPFFDMTPEEKAAVTNTTIKQINHKFLPHKRGVERVAAVEQIPDISQLHKEIGDVQDGSEPFFHEAPAGKPLESDE